MRAILLLLMVTAACGSNPGNQFELDIAVNAPGATSALVDGTHTLPPTGGTYSQGFATASAAASVHGTVETIAADGSVRSSATYELGTYCSNEMPLLRQDDALRGDDRRHRRADARARQRRLRKERRHRYDRQAIGAAAGREVARRGSSESRLDALLGLPASAAVRPNERRRIKRRLQSRANANDRSPPPLSLVTRATWMPTFANQTSARRGPPRPALLVRSDSVSGRSEVSHSSDACAVQVWHALECGIRCCGAIAGLAVVTSGRAARPCPRCGSALSTRLPP